MEGCNVMETALLRPDVGHDPGGASNLDGGRTHRQLILPRVSVERQWDLVYNADSDLPLEGSLSFCRLLSV
ncbi:MAG: hypothetical protein Kow0047_25600 [Anaerolineae bacterium]